MSIPDGRVSAWASALMGIEMAQSVRMKIHEHDGQAPLPDLYFAAMREAECFAELAKVDPTVGVSVGAWLEERREAQIQQAGESAAVSAEMFLEKIRRDEAKDDEVVDKPYGEDDESG